MPFGYLLSISGAANVELLNQGYDVPAISK